MRTNTIFKTLALLALPVMWSCSSIEEPEAPVVPEPDGEVSTYYLAVNVQDAASLGTTRADDSETQPEYSKGDEHEVTNGVFFFFKADSTYICTGHIKRADWNDSNDSNDESGNVEYIGRNIITMPLATGDKPAFMITALNHDEGVAQLIYERGTSAKGIKLAEVGALLSNYNPYTAGTPFMMTTSSYLGADGSKIFFTPIPETAIKPTLAEAEADKNTALPIYVERLAAKVELKGLTKNGQHDIIGGKLIEYDPDSKAQKDTGKQLVARVNSWGLSGTARQSYLSKQLGAAIEGWEWNRELDHRSFWGLGYWYGKDITDDYKYLGGDGKVTPYPEKDDFQLRFVNWSQLSAPIDGPDYCLEHTSTPAKWTSDINTLETKKITCALVSATLGTVEGEGDNAKFTPLDVIYYQGDLVQSKDFIPYMLNELDQTARLNFWHMEENDGKKTYTQVSDKDFKIELKGNGTGKLKLTYTGSGDLYRRLIDDAGKYTGEYQLLSGTDADVTTSVNKWATPVAYTGGAMYYVIPIRHINHGGTASDFVTKEGAYGVVRNHLYEITVNKIANLGYGVFYPGTGEEPGEPIIPDDPDPERHIKADVKVLSWKIVRQNIDL